MSREDIALRYFEALRSGVTTEALRKIPDVGLVGALYNHIQSMRFGESMPGEDDVRRLPPGPRMIYSVSALRTMIDCDGFEATLPQAEWLVPLVSEGLLLIGAKKLAGVVRRAESIFERHVKRHGRGKRSIEQFATLAVEGGPLEKLDVDFYQHAEDCDRRMVRYVRRHPKDFVWP